jgi:hypothetical protein
LPSERATIASVSAADGQRRCGREQRRQLLTVEWAQLDQERRARAPDAVGQPAHARGRGGLVRTAGPKQQDPPVVEVVREEDDEVERRGVGPVQVLEYEQHRCGGCAVAEHRQRLLEHPELRGNRLAVDLPKLPERTQGLDERLVRQLGADQIDRAPNQHLEARVAGACRQLGRQPGLADASVSGDQRGRAAPRPRRAQGALELPELADASDEDLAGGSLHLGSVAPPGAVAEGARTHPATGGYVGRRRRIRLSDRCAPGSCSPTIRSIRRARAGAR